MQRPSRSHRTKISATVSSYELATTDYYENFTTTIIPKHIFTAIANGTDSAVARTLETAISHPKSSVRTLCTTTANLNFVFSK